jgi:hypothetical protein
MSSIVPLFDSGGRYTLDGQVAAEKIEAGLDEFVSDLVDSGYDGVHVAQLFNLVTDHLISYHAGNKYREAVTN